MGICLKPYSLQKMSVTAKPEDRFFSNFTKWAEELSSFISASVKSIVTVELTAQIAGQI